MISPKFFYDTLTACGIDFYAGVPDSLLKNLCAYITDHADERHNIIAANEGGAMGLAAGHYTKYMKKQQMKEMLWVWPPDITLQQEKYR